MTNKETKKIAISVRNEFTRKFMLKNEDGEDVQEIELGVTVDKYNNPTLHIAPVHEEDEIFLSDYTLEYDLFNFCHDAATGYLGIDDNDKKLHVDEICRSLRRTAEVLEYKYKRLTGN